MAEITVKRLDDRTFEVTILEGGGSTTHEVTVEAADVEHLSGSKDAARLVEASIRFLLDREPKESILGRFGLSVISRYFPEYESRIGDYL